MRANKPEPSWHVGRNTPGPLSGVGELRPDSPLPAEIPVNAIREGEVPGTHIIRWNSPVDEIRIEHRAHSRAGFAAGAVLAARWLAGKTGVFGMNDVLELE